MIAFYADMTFDLEIISIYEGEKVVICVKGVVQHASI